MEIIYLFIVTFVQVKSKNGFKWRFHLAIEPRIKYLQQAPSSTVFIVHRGFQTFQWRSLVVMSLLSNIG